MAPVSTPDAGPADHRVDPGEGVEVVLLAGGAGRRFGRDAAGRDKVDLLLPTTLAGLPRWLGTPVVVGPPRPNVVARWCREDPPGGGPVAALAAALPLLGGPRVVVLAADMPDGGRAVPALLAGLHDGADVAVLVDAQGRRQPLAAAWHTDALARALGAVGEVAGAAARTLLAGAVVAEVADRWGAARDVDLPADLRPAGGHGQDEAVHDLAEWVAALAAELGVAEPDLHAVLDLARDAATAVERPAAPLTTYLVGYAAGAAGGGPTSAAAAMATARELAARWAAARPDAT